MSEPGGVEAGMAADGVQSWEALARAAAGGKGAEEVVPTRELLVFLLGGTPYAVPVERVREIVRMRTVTPMPRVPPEIRGVIALRGEVVQVVDLPRRLGLGEAVPGRTTRIIVLHGDDDRVTGVLVDAVREVTRISEDHIRPASSGEDDTVSEIFLRDGDFVSIMDLDRVLEFRALG